MSERPSQNTLIAASYNIHRCFGIDRKYHPERVCEVLRSLDADIIGLQEVDMRLLVDGRPQLAYLAETLKMHAVSGATAPERRSHFGNALLSRFPITAVRRTDLSVRRFEPRGAIEAELAWGDISLRVVVTHLGLRASERRLQVRRLLHSLDDGRTDEEAERPMILLGDFNEWSRGNRSIRSLIGRFGHPLMPRTFPSRMPLLPLDRIWAWPQGAVSRLKVHATPLSRIASDHLPIRGEIAWEATALPMASREAPSLSKV